MPFFRSRSIRGENDETTGFAVVLRGGNKFSAWADRVVVGGVEQEERRLQTLGRQNEPAAKSGGAVPALSSCAECDHGPEVGVVFCKQERQRAAE